MTSEAMRSTANRLSARNDGVSLWRELTRPFRRVSGTGHFPVIPFARSGLTQFPDTDWGITAD